MTSAEEFVPKVKKQKKTPRLSDTAIEIANQRKQLKKEGAPKKDIEKMIANFEDRLVKRNKIHK